MVRMLGSFYNHSTSISFILPYHTRLLSLVLLLLGNKEEREFERTVLALLSRGRYFMLRRSLFVLSFSSKAKTFSTKRTDYGGQQTSLSQGFIPDRLTVL